MAWCARSIAGLTEPIEDCPVVRLGRIADSPGESRVSTCDLRLPAPTLEAGRGEGAARVGNDRTRGPPPNRPPRRDGRRWLLGPHGQNTGGSLSEVPRWRVAGRIDRYGSDGRLWWTWTASRWRRTRAWDGKPRNRSRNRHPVPVAVMGADQSVGHESTKSFLTFGRSIASPSVW